MKKISPFILLLAALFLTGCSSFKIIKSYKSDSVYTMQDKNILVVGRSTKKDVRMAYEDAITKKLVASGYKATASYKKYPDFKPNTKVSDDQKQHIRTILEKDGYNGVVLTLLKDIVVNSREVGAEQYDAAVIYGGASMPSVYGGFYAYWDLPGSYSVDQVALKQEGTTITSKLYTLETVIYNLDKEDGEQLEAWITASIENPDNVINTATAYANSIAKGFKGK
ncbi:MAG: hypothetical protein WBM91_07835 [Eudoraea sp.]|uniref:hypothetical protein n=1 Tax=Eudoraea sp. TaxID=1979955 RepID=UPI003C74BEB0